MFRQLGGWFIIKMPSYQYRKSQCGDKTILRHFDLHNGVSYTGKMTFFILNRDPGSRSVAYCTHVIDNVVWRKESTRLTYNSDVIAGKTSDGPDDRVTQLEHLVGICRDVRNASIETDWIFNFAKSQYYSRIMHTFFILMSAMASLITDVSIVCSTVCWGADQRKHQSCASLGFVRGIHRSPHKWPVTRKMFPFDDVIMTKQTKTETCAYFKGWNAEKQWTFLWTTFKMTISARLTANTRRLCFWEWRT